MKNWKLIIAAGAASTLASFAFAQEAPAAAPAAQPAPAAAPANATIAFEVQSKKGVVKARNTKVDGKDVLVMTLAGSKNSAEVEKLLGDAKIALDHIGTPNVDHGILVLANKNQQDAERKALEETIGFLETLLKRAEEEKLDNFEGLALTMDPANPASFSTSPASAADAATPSPDSPVSPTQPAVPAGTPGTGTPVNAPDPSDSESSIPVTDNSSIPTSPVNN